MSQCCYLLHFDPPYHHAKHYIGWTVDLEARVDRHFDGHGSPLVRAAIEAGVVITVARVWPDGDRTLERKLHNRHGTRLCPICKGGKDNGEIVVTR